MVKTLFENLSNEILLDLFEYFSTFELFQSLTKLNLRFDKLISQSFYRHQFDFRCFSSEEINEFLHNENLFDEDFPIKSLIISPNVDSSFPFLNLINEKFFSQLNQLTHLHLIDLHYSTSLQLIGFQLKNLSQLIDLKFERCVFPLDEEDYLILIDQIWSCEQLKSCLLNISRPFTAEFLSPTIRSTSIRSIILSEISMNSVQMSNLFLQTPQLEYFHFDNEQLINTFSILPEQIRLTKLVLIISICNEQVLRNILENQQNLRELFVDLNGFCFDGNQWKSIIENSLTKLEKFDFREEFSIETNENEQKFFNEYVQTFENEFWIDQHRWFVHCQLILTDLSWIISISTIPYRFSSLILYDSFDSRTTSSSSSIIKHKNIRHLSFHGNDLDLSTLVQFYPNITSLEIHSPFDRLSLSIFESFRHLKSLEICLSSIDPHRIRSSKISLETLKISQTNLSIIFKYFQDEIHQIKFLNLQNNIEPVQNDDEVDSLIRLCSQLQCEILALDIRDSTNIRRLIDESSKLKQLLLHSHDDLLYSTDRDKEHFIRFLQGHLSIKCRIFRDLNIPEQIHVYLLDR